MQPAATRPDRALIVILAVIVVIVIVALVVVFTRGGPADVDPTSPEGVVQAYTQAVIADEYPSARELLTAEIRDHCDRITPSNLQGLRMTVMSTKVVGDTAVVRVALEHGSGTYGGSNYEYDDVFSMVREDSLWKIDSAPWDLEICDNLGAGS